MQNLIPLGTGNSRFMKSNISPSTTLAQLIQMLNNGTFPYDIGTLNPAGISQQGTPLNKDTLLKDATAQLYGLTPSTAVPDDVFQMLSKATKYSTTQASTPVQVSSFEVGQIVKFLHNGVVKNFMVMDKNYEPSLNSNRTLFLQIDRENNLAWDSSGSENYNGSTIDNYLITTYLHGFDLAFQTLIDETTIQYYPNRNLALTTMNRSVFLLDGNEFGQTNASTSEIGTAGQEVAGAQIFWQNYYANNMIQAWTRSVCRNQSDRAYGIYSENTANPYVMDFDTTVEMAFNPAFTLSNSTTLYQDENGILRTEAVSENAITDLLGNSLIPLPVLQIGVGTYTGTGTYGSANPTSFTCDGTPKFMVVSGKTNGGFGVFVPPMLTTAFSPYGYAGVLNSALSVSQGFYARLNGNTISWYVGSSADRQLNTDGVVYYVVYLY